MGSMYGSGSGSSQPFNGRQHNFSDFQDMMSTRMSDMQNMMTQRFDDFRNRMQQGHENQRMNMAPTRMYDKLDGMASAGFNFGQSGGLSNIPSPVPNLPDRPQMPYSLPQPPFPNLPERPQMPQDQQGMEQFRSDLATYQQQIKDLMQQYHTQMRDHFRNMWGAPPFMGRWGDRMNG